MTLGDGKKYQVLALDTEGFGAPGASVDSDAQVFALASLLCSLLVYNRCELSRCSHALLCSTPTTVFHVSALSAVDLAVWV